MISPERSAESRSAADGAEEAATGTDTDVSGPGKPVPRGPLWTVVDAILFVSVLALVLTVSVQVGTRLLGRPEPWTEELTRFCFVYATFLGMAVGFRNASHARIVFVVGRLPRPLKKAMVHLYAAAGILFFSLVAVQAWELIQQQLQTGESTAVLGVGMYLMTVPVLAGAVLAIVAHVQSVYRSADVRHRIEHGEMTSV
ncbi:TRAP-type C4-dicarboxylate transport system permease small subunit [Haloactinopolyspora alba]|uniref:TRAP-type C4-dicarboxylate transport system permease small subunit n=1 Tax=Haloactinopolyspora alba TaxID=648780 RepID=A0A2P8EF33_9ACTN|nr:TRAP transporter small permease [Haloactinopolyspora alba]PSL08060.1 TRAP-type C4-dicarboxylate transport system permease small subunit [Haloactinopolyspora alba]